MSMHAIPALSLLSAAVGLGIYMGLRYLRRLPIRPGMIAVHLLLGAGGLEVLAMMLRGSPDGTVMPARNLAAAAAGLLALGLMAGIAAPLIGRGTRRTMNIALAAHAGIAFAGFVLLIVWVARNA